MNNPTSLVALERIVQYAVRQQAFLSDCKKDSYGRQSNYCLWLANACFVSGMLKVAHWQTALDLAANEYPVRFLPSVDAAHLGVSLEVLGVALLALGFMTRYAAASLLRLSLVIPFAYKPFDSQLLWVALFGRYTVCGAGPLSIDRILRRGLANEMPPLMQYRGDDTGDRRTGNDRFDHFTLRYHDLLAGNQICALQVQRDRALTKGPVREFSKLQFS